MDIEKQEEKLGLAWQGLAAMFYLSDEKILCKSVRLLVMGFILEREKGNFEGVKHYGYELIDLFGPKNLNFSTDKIRDIFEETEREMKFTS